jgi:Zn-dependent protease
MLRMGITLFRRGEFSVKVDPSLFVILAILGFDPGVPFRLDHLLAWIGVAAGCILVHELGHALAFAAFGATPQVLLYGMGGLTSARGSFSAAKSVIISLAGPIAGFGIGGVFWLVGPGSTELSHAIYVDGLIATFGFGILNLLPVLPLDGGSALLSLFKLAHVPDADRLARYVSIGVAGLGALYLLRRPGFTWIFPLMFLGQNLADLKRMKEEPTRDRVRAAFHALLGGRPGEAAQIAAEVLAQRPSHEIAEIAAETLVWSQLALGQVAEARASLGLRPGRPAGDLRPVERLPEAAVALAEGAGDSAVAVIAASLDNGEWAPPNVLIPLLERTGTLPAVQARLHPQGAELLAKLQQAL